ncbi:ferritin-like fold-containing protein [Paeniglutamicibacter kerguelensis]|uniref:tRNA isopentenyl-2-thiomethyl-A-37 hydroxylase MiaE n=1 Tax=Paeniglutamicibacter kerguelensis TaxID=254788 RepID=A0ABS4XE51_9MICC|nr:ferritin-like fold-containing protein [Paeniglutamicibacter kerguelensis]MBP2386744.1 tRNA isopentenyl-2-thiomethyl-A-37 hydroxylase MiaE [Paeniglutamicibacter kerguelensis]
MRNPSATPARRDAAQDEMALLGLIAYQELTAFEHLSSDARFSPTLVDRETLARLAVTEFGHYELIREIIASRGMDAQEVMEPFMSSLDEMHERTKPGDWYESLTKAYVIDGVAADFYSYIASELTEESRSMVQSVKTSDANTEWLKDRLQLAISDRPDRASRLALWGRRLLGEALTQAREIGEQYDYWGSLEERGDRGQTMTALFARLVENHSRRMSKLGMTA